jgi:ABC-type uncharacterized transport system involved in gliding motility auxiliary subunit
MSIAHIGYWLFVGSVFAIIGVWAFVPLLNVYEVTYLVLLGLALVGLGLWFFFSLDRIRFWFKQRSTQFMLSLLIMAVMSLVILGGINWIAVVQNKKIDLTANKLHTLSSQTLGVLSKLESTVRIRVWTTNVEAISPNIDVKGMLENYRLAGKGKIEIEVRNPNQFMNEANEDQIRRNNVIIVKDTKTGRESRVENFSDSKGEEQITNAIINATKGRKKQLCFIAGYGQPSIESREPTGLSFLKESLENSNYETREIVLSNVENIPKECELLANVGPRNVPVERELKMIRDYLNAGGEMIALVGPRAPRVWKEFFKDVGVHVREDLLLDRFRRDNPVLVQTRNYASDVNITDGFNAVTIFPEASSIQVPSDLSGSKVSVRAFVSSEAHVYTKAGEINSIKNIRPAPSDRQGPIPIGVLIERSVGNEAEIAPEKPTSKEGAFYKFRLPELIPSAHAQDGMDSMAQEGSGESKEAPKNQSRVVLFSSDLFVVNGIVAQGGNMDLFLNSVNSLLGDESLMGIRPRDLRQTFLRVTPQDMRMVVGFFLIAAGLFLVFGIKAARRKTSLA